MQILNKGLIGAAISIGIHAAATSRYFFIAGLLPLFPAFAILAHWSVGQERSHADLRSCIIFTMLSLLPYAGYLVSMLWCIERYSLTKSLLVSSLVWGLLAVILIVLWQYFTVKTA